ncbi:hypothetical protein ABZ867_22810 [Streptomyces cinnamoneus]|uniref:hypothetical protein n=1 Tax=Streptomyces sp. IGB124 TaxID=1519485 RepID=UPI0006AF0708|nr:hypothetical protein [Streptomyces sp. IGB124]
MDGPSHGGSAWPFLVARGRYRGYRTLLAPDFLLADGDYGVLDDFVKPGTAAEQVQVVPVVTRSGRPLTVVHTTHQVTAADVEQAPRDEFGRPLQLMYGFVCDEGQVGAPDPADLDACRETAIAVYRRFLGDEEGFTVEAGRQFPLRSAVTPRTVVERPPLKGTSVASAPSRTGCLIRVAILVLIGVLLYALATQCPPEQKDADPDCVPVHVFELCHPYVDAPPYGNTPG